MLLWDGTGEMIHRTISFCSALPSSLLLVLMAVPSQLGRKAREMRVIRCSISRFVEENSVAPFSLLLSTRLVRLVCFFPASSYPNGRLVLCWELCFCCTARLTRYYSFAYRDKAIRYHFRVDSLSFFLMHFKVGLLGRDGRVQQL